MNESDIYIHCKASGDITYSTEVELEVIFIK
jgi:hypothetical protein